MRTMIILSAIPGSGKSTWARRYQAENPNTHIISSDELRKTLYGRVNNFEHEKDLWAHFLQSLNSFEGDDVTVIADATNLTNAYRRYYLEQTPSYERHILVCFNIPFDICRFQNRQRENERVVPEDAMDKLIAEWETPNQETIDLFDEVIFVGPNFVSEKAKALRS